MSANNYEKVCFEIISYAGTAKSCFLEAIELAKDGQNVSQVMEEGNKAFQEASMTHHRALQAETKKELDVGLLLIHAETILSSAETIRDLSATIIELIEKNDQVSN